MLAANGPSSCAELTITSAQAAPQPNAEINATVHLCPDFPPNLAPSTLTSSASNREPPMRTSSISAWIWSRRWTTLQFRASCASRAAASPTDWARTTCITGTAPSARWSIARTISTYGATTSRSVSVSRVLSACARPSEPSRCPCCRAGMSARTPARARCLWLRKTCPLHRRSAGPHRLLQRRFGHQQVGRQAPQWAISSRSIWSISASATRT